VNGLRRPIERRSPFSRRLFLQLGVVPLDHALVLVEEIFDARDTAAVTAVVIADPNHFLAEPAQRVVHLAAVDLRNVRVL